MKKLSVSILFVGMISPVELDGKVWSVCKKLGLVTHAIFQRAHDLDCIGVPLNVSPLAFVVMPERLRQDEGENNRDFRIVSELTEQRRECSAPHRLHVLL